MRGEYGRLLQWPAGARLGARAVAGVERRECTDSVGVRKECWQDLMMLQLWRVTEKARSSTASWILVCTFWWKVVPFAQREDVWQRERTMNLLWT